jgi:glucose/arabinose dehydrogenase
MLLRSLTLAAGLCLATVPASAAVTVPTGFVAEDYVTGLSSPTSMAFAPDGRLFICEQGGNLRVVKDGVLQSTPFLSLDVDSNGERGLLGVAFDPDFATNRYLYIYYTVPSSAGGPHNRVARVRASSTDPNVAGAGTLKTIFDLPQLSSATNHNGGALLFKRGKLFIAVGENANGDNSQSLSTVLGKILRINTDGTIPDNNPFFNQTTGQNRAIWATGVRNPFTLAIQPGTERIFINDVGQNTWEEIDDGKPGANYGWPQTEGPTSAAGITPPLYAYTHDQADSPGCAIIGGAFYNPVSVKFPQRFVGRYFYSDLCGGWIHVFNPSTKTFTAFANGLQSPTSIRVNDRGNLFALELGAGRVTRIRYTGAAGGAKPPSEQKF